MMLPIKYLFENKILKTFLLVLITALLCFQNLIFYLKPDLSLIVFLAIAPFIFTINNNEKSIRFAWFSLVFVLLYFFFKMQLLYYLSFSFFILFIIESNLGKVNTLALFIILLISPYSSFIFNVFGFPARLLLSETAAHILSFVFDDVKNNGNNILINNQLFSVDPACIGLKMIEYGYATALLFINYLERKFELKLKFYQVMATLFIGTFFIILVNLFRIIILVILAAKPETITHEMAGLLSFGIYFMLPQFFITRWIILRKGKIDFQKPSSKQHLKNLSYVLTALIIVALAYFNLNRENYRNILVDNKTDTIQLSGYEKSTTNNNVMKFENEQALIYIKPACDFFGPDHNPTICWKGSGYKFINITEHKRNTYEFYTAELKRENEILQTAWWFDNGSEKIVSQFEWRYKTALGQEPFRLVNVTTTSKEELDQQINLLMEKNLF